MKTVTSARNPLNGWELNNYYDELNQLKMLRFNIKYDIGKKWNRVYTEPQAGGKCRMKLYGMKKKYMKEILEYAKLYDKRIFSIEKHCENLGYGKVYSIVLRVK